MRASAILVGGRLGALSTTVGASITLPSPDSPDWDLIEAQAAVQSHRVARSSAIVIIALVCALWPLDLALIERAPAQQLTFTHWRLALVGVFGAMYLTFRFVPAARRFPVAVSAPFSMGACYALGDILGGLGGLDRPYFGMASAAMIVPILAQAGLLPRVAFTLSLAAALCAGYFLSWPQHLNSPLLWEALINLGTLVIGSVLIGHGGYIGFCQRFFQGLVIERTALALKTLNDELGERVRAKTADLRRLAEHLQVVQEEERGRIARELHDELGQRLSAMRYVIANTSRRYARAPASIAPNLAELDEMVDGALESTRAIVSGLRPPLLEQLGLSAAIEWLALRMTAQAGLRCTLELDEAEVQSAAVSVAAYRVLQESLTNVARHARATGATVRLRVGDERLSLEVVDDGVGFPRQADASSEGNGILGMRERARALGGELLTENPASGGARVHLSLPLHPTRLEDAP